MEFRVYFNSNKLSLPFTRNIDNECTAHLAGAGVLLPQLLRRHARARVRLNILNY